MDSIQTFIEKFTTAVDFQNPVPIHPDTQLSELPEWDSLATLSIIVMSDMEYGKTITGNDLANCKSIQDIYALVN
jgi:acyl carrier protein